jgi:excisionase family DNA binding protein
MTQFDNRREPAQSEVLMAQCYTINDLARLLQCSTRHIQRLNARHIIPGAIRFGGLLRFARPMIDKWLVDGGGSEQP